MARYLFGRQRGRYRRYFFLVLIAAMTSATTLMYSWVIFPARESLAAVTSIPMTGYLWSETIGWISLNCSNDSPPCATSNYSMVISPGGIISGYGWSEHIGWVSAEVNDITSCPLSPCLPNIAQDGTVSGWFRAIAGRDDPQNGGWDGWIRLSGVSPAYGPVLDSGTGNFSGYAWGSDVVGWVDFSPARATYCPPTPAQCIDPSTLRFVDVDCTITDTNCTYGCVSGGCAAPPPPTADFDIQPLIIYRTGSVRIDWTAYFATSCSITGTNGDNFPSLSTSGTQPSGSIIERTKFTLTCIGIDPTTSYTESIMVNIIPYFREF